MNKKQLLQKREAARKAFKDYADQFAATLMNADQQSEYDKLKAERDGFDAAVKRAEENEEYERNEASAAPGYALNGTGENSAGKDRKEDQKFTSLGEQLVAVAEYSVSKGHQRDPRLFNAAALGQNETVDSEGGFLIAPEFAGGLITRTFQSNEILQRVTTRPMASSRLILNGIVDDNRVGGPAGAGIIVYRVAEAGLITASKLKFRRVELNANKLVGAYFATDEVLEDAPALQSEIEDYFPTAFNWRIINEIINGTGQGQMLGINNCGALVITPKTSGQATGTFTTQNALDMRTRFWVGGRANGVWVVGPDIEALLFSLTIPGPQGTAVALYTPPGMNGNKYGMMLGMPVIVVEQTAPLSTQGDVMLVDFSQYVVGERGGIKSASSIHVQFLTDEQVFRWTLRNDGQPTWDKAVTQNNSSNKVSPFVVLQTR